MARPFTTDAHEAHRVTPLRKLKKVAYAETKGELALYCDDGGEAVILRPGMPLNQVVYALRHLAMRIESRIPSTGDTNA
jgi:hypothetical protein